MFTRHNRWWLCLALGLFLGSSAVAADKPAAGKESLSLTSVQTEFLWLEPVLVSVRLNNAGTAALPAALGQGRTGLRFAIEPPVNARKGAKLLPLEAQAADAKVPVRRFDLFEHFNFPDKGGTWTIRAVLEQDGATLTSEPIRVTIRKPAAGDKEQQPVARIHHAPWSNYDTNAFCGDTFDLVKNWPDSRLAHYCHYWNGRYSQNKKEYDKAIASYRTVVEKFPDFLLAEDAAFGIVECLVAQKKLDEARKQNTALREKLKDRPARTVVPSLVADMDRRLGADAGAKK